MQKVFSSVNFVTKFLGEMMVPKMYLRYNAHNISAAKDGRGNIFQNKITRLSCIHTKCRFQCICLVSCSISSRKSLCSHVWKSALQLSPKNMRSSHLAIWYHNWSVSHQRTQCFSQQMKLLTTILTSFRKKIRHFLMS